MNRYEITGTVMDLLEGRNVIFLGSGVHVNAVFYGVLDRLNELELTPDRTIRANGRERIEIQGGKLTFARSLDALRGRSADVVLIGPQFQFPATTDSLEVLDSVREVAIGLHLVECISS